MLSRLVVISGYFCKRSKPSYRVRWYRANRLETHYSSGWPTRRRAGSYREPMCRLPRSPARSESGLSNCVEYLQASEIGQGLANEGGIRSCAWLDYGLSSRFTYQILQKSVYKNVCFTQIGAFGKRLRHDECINTVITATTCYLVGEAHRSKRRG